MESWNYHGVQGNHEALLGFVGIKGYQVKSKRHRKPNLKEGHEVGKLYFKTFKFLQY